VVRTLELFDETVSPAKATGHTATLRDDGQVTFAGNGVRSIISKWLVDHPAEEVFNKMAGWSNGYATLQEREQ
jgi:hypothetical protein